MGRQKPLEKLPKKPSAEAGRKEGKRSKGLEYGKDGVKKPGKLPHTRRVLLNAKKT